MITQLAHIAYRVRDLEASLAFYGKLGIHESFRLNRDDGSVWIVYLQLNRDQFVELFPSSNPSVPIPLNGGSYHHFCFQVDDLDVTVSDLQSRGVAIDQPMTMGKDNNLQAWIVDPDGNRIELMQIMPDSPQAAAGKAFR